MRRHWFDVRFALLASVAAVILAGSVAGAQTQPAISTGLIGGFCGGATSASGATTNGVIPTAPAIGAGKQGEASVVALAFIITIMVLSVMALAYSIGALLNIKKLQAMAKSEFVEAVGTFVIIGIVFGGFFAAAGLFGSAANSGATTVFTGPVRNVFVTDCDLLSGSSVALLFPALLFDSATQFFVSIPSSLSLSFAPDNFGFSMQPLAGMDLLAANMKILEDLSNYMVLALLGATFMLGLIYSVLPIMLYLGIVLRAFPWTRAAGGVLIAVFIGFFMVFPILLAATLVGFQSFTAQMTVQANGGAQITTLENIPAQVIQDNSGLGALNYIGSEVASVFKAFFSKGYGLINGYIYEVIEPAGFTIFDIVLALIISIDFTDQFADLLGAPSLSSGGLLPKVL